MKPIHVTDHCVLRYLERAKGYDIEAVRRHIAKICGGPIDAGASCIRIEGVKFEVADRKVVTCAPGGGGVTRTKRARLAAGVVP